MIDRIIQNFFMKKTGNLWSRITGLIKLEAKSRPGFLLISANAKLKKHGETDIEYFRTAFCFGVLQ